MSRLTLLMPLVLSFILDCMKAFGLFFRMPLFALDDCGWLLSTISDLTFLDSYIYL